MSLDVGDIVGNNLRLVRMLAEGGMGSVWIADHLTLHAQVAVKFVSGSLASHPDAFARFSREATAAAQLRHPHVIQIFDHGVTSDGTPYIVMELLEGEDLGARIEHVGPLNPADLASIITQAARALGAAHAKGIIHRDIKPENIFLANYDGQTFVKVVDFGIAKQQSEASRSMTGTGVAIGTPYYMSPEQAMSTRDVDHRSDLWSLAVVAYHAMTGKRPFEGETVAGVYVSINACDFAPPSSINPALSPLVDQWFVRALSRKPDHRFASAKELAQAFEEAVAGTWQPGQATRDEPPAPPEPVRARTAMESFHKAPTLTGTSATGRTEAPKKSSGKWVAIGGGVFLLAALSVGGLFAMASDTEPVAPDKGDQRLVASGGGLVAPAASAIADAGPEAGRGEPEAAEGNSLAIDDLPVVKKGPVTPTPGTTVASTKNTGAAAPPPKPPPTGAKPPAANTKPAGEFYGF